MGTASGIIVILSKLTLLVAIDYDMSPLMPLSLIKSFKSLQLLVLVK